MEIYFIYIELLAKSPGVIATIIGSTVIGIIATWFSGIWVAALLVKEKFLLSNQFSNNWQWLHPVIFASGLGSLLTVWTVTLYFHIELSWGALILVFPALLGGVLFWRSNLNINRSGWLAISLISLITFLMGLWQHALTDLPMEEGLEYLVYSDLHQDLTFHVALASIIEGSGLPLINVQPSPTYEFSGLAHTGHITLIAGFSNLLGISKYMASTVVWLISMLLTAWGVLALLTKQANLGIPYKLLIVVATLVWGSSILPDPRWLLNPGQAVSHANPGLWIASRSYWNISQALSIGLTLGGLLLLDLYCEFRKKNEIHLFVLGLSVGLIVLGGFTKPSLVIFYGPALIIWLFLSGARALEYLVALIVLAAGFLIYFLPAFLNVIPSMPSWSLASDQQQWLGVAKFLWQASLSLAIVTFVIVSKSISTGWRDRQWQLIDLGVIAFGGSVLFAILFRENQFVGFWVLQPNIWWGLSACIVLLVPLVGREVSGLMQSNGWRRRVVILGLVIAMVQVINGLSVALAYPILTTRKHVKNLAVTLKTAQQLTDVSTRFAIDPSLFRLDLYPYLSRPTLYFYSFASHDSKSAYLAWINFCSTGKGNPPLERLDAVVLHRNREHANLYFSKLGWQSTRLDETYMLWRKTDQ